MDPLTREIRFVQNPALGAALQWRFCCGYVDANRTHDPVPLPLLFLVLPIAFHSQTEEFVYSTQKASGLRAFAAKFGRSDAVKQDLLLGIHERMLVLKELSWESARIGLTSKLLHLETGALFPTTTTPAVTGVPKSVRRLLTSSEKLGSWCGPLTMHEIAATLKVRF